MDGHYNLPRSVKFLAFISSFLSTFTHSASKIQTNVWLIQATPQPHTSPYRYQYHLPETHSALKFKPPLGSTPVPKKTQPNPSLHPFTSTAHATHRTIAVTLSHSPGQAQFGAPLSSPEHNRDEISRNDDAVAAPPPSLVN